MVIRLLGLVLLVTSCLALPAAALAQDNGAAGNGVTATTNTTAVKPTPTPTHTAPNPAPTPSADSAAPPPGVDKQIPESGMVLVKLFVLAVILESALAIIFTWRPFIVTFDRRAVKPLVSVAVALLVTFWLRPDALFTLAQSYNPKVTGDGNALALSRIVEAFVIAGGSNGVKNMLIALGVRAPDTAIVDSAIRRLAPDKAWLSVTLASNWASRPVRVEITTQPDDSAWQLIGMINGDRLKNWFAKFFLTDKGRFPTVAGWPIATDKPYRVRVVDANGHASVPWGPTTFAPGAIVDVALTLPTPTTTQ